jgi:hypothetical protein
VTRRKPRRTTLRAVVGGRVYYVSAIVHPRRSASHDGPDSPHYMDPGSPPRLEITRVLRDAIEVFPDRDLRDVLLTQCSRAAGISETFIVHRPEQRTMEFTA